MFKLKILYKINMNKKIYKYEYTNYRLFIFIFKYLNNIYFLFFCLK